MGFPVKCKNCGKVLGNKIRYFKQKVQEKYKEHGKEKDAEDQYLTLENYNSVQKSTECELMDGLDVKAVCCRTILMTHVEEDY